MNITLTEKDADFILNHLRADLQRVIDTCDRIFEREKQLEEVMASIANNGSDAEKLMSNFYEKEIKGYLSEYEELFKQYTDRAAKCIELLTCGSKL